MAADDKDPITCHVLDTMTGRPGAAIKVKLYCLAMPTMLFEGETNADGRIANWRNNRGLQGTEPGDTSHLPTSTVSRPLIECLIQKFGIEADCLPGSSSWKLEFDTGAYYGLGNTFFPVIELTFLVKKGEHFHVPLLLSPYSYTTYRGS